MNIAAQTGSGPRTSETTDDNILVAGVIGIVTLR